MGFTQVGNHCSICHRPWNFVTAGHRIVPRQAMTVSYGPPRDSTLHGPVMGYFLPATKIFSWGVSDHGNNESPPRKFCTPVFIFGHLVSLQSMWIALSQAAIAGIPTLDGHFIINVSSLTVYIVSFVGTSGSPWSLLYRYHHAMALYYGQCFC